MESDGREYCKYKIGDLVHLDHKRYMFITDIKVVAGYLYYETYYLEEPEEIILRETTLLEHIVQINHR